MVFESIGLRVDNTYIFTRIFIRSSRKFAIFFLLHRYLGDLKFTAQSSSSFELRQHNYIFYIFSLNASRIPFLKYSFFVSLSHSNISFTNQTIRYFLSLSVFIRRDIEQKFVRIRSRS